MNKSKFLKRSLAAILAILMVVAMVPSALAAQVVNESVPTARVFNDPGYLISVGGDRAVWDADNGAYKVSTTFNEGNAIEDFKVSMIEVDRNTVTVKETEQVLGATVEELNPDKAVKSVDSFGVGTYTYTLVAVVTDANGDTISTNEYKLIIDLTMKTKSSDATIKAVKSVKLPYAVSAKYDNAKNTIDIVMALGKRDHHDKSDTLVGLASGVQVKDIFVPTSDTATSVEYAYGSASDNKATVTVTAENGDTKVYAVSFTEETAFDTFKIGDFEGKAVATNPKKIIIDLPYEYLDAAGTNMDATKEEELEKLLATWTVPTGSKVYIGGTADSDIKESGKEKLAIASPVVGTSDAEVYGTDPSKYVVKQVDTSANQVAVKTKKSGDTPVNVGIYFRIPAQNPDAELTGIQISNNKTIASATNYTQYIAVDKGSRNITINLPYGMKKTASADGTYKLYIKVWGAKNSYIELAEGRVATSNGFSNAGNNNDGKGLQLDDVTEIWSTNAVNVSKPITLKVISEDEKTTLLYNVTVNESTSTAANLDTIKLVNGKGEEVGKVTKDSTGKNIDITLPYKYSKSTYSPSVDTNEFDIADLKLVATGSSSAKIGYVEGEVAGESTKAVYTQTWAGTDFDAAPSDAYNSASPITEKVVPIVLGGHTYQYHAGVTPNNSTTPTSSTGYVWADGVDANAAVAAFVNDYKDNATDKDDWDVAVDGTTKTKVIFTAKTAGSLATTGATKPDGTDGTDGVDAGADGASWTPFVKEEAVGTIISTGLVLGHGDENTDGEDNIFTLRVSNGSANGSNLYKVTLKRGDPSTAAEIKNTVKVTDSATRTDMTEYGAKVNTRSGKETSTIVVNEMPYTLAVDNKDMYFSNLEVSPEAHVLIVPVTEPATTPGPSHEMEVDTTSSSNSNSFSVRGTTERWDKKDKYIEVWVFSEADWYKPTADGGMNGTIGSATKDLATKVYKMSASYTPAGTGSELTSIASTLDETIKVDKVSKTVTITVPASYVKSGTVNPDGKAFTLNIKTSPFASILGASIASDGTVTEGSTITPDEGDTKKQSTATPFVVYKDGTDYKLKAATALDNTAPTGSEINGIVVKSQDTNNTSVNNVVVKVAPVETSNAIESITVAGKTATKGADGETWDLVLPVDADLVQLVDIKTASKLATVEVDTVDYDKENYYDLGDDLSIKVTAENGEAFTYTLKTVREGINTNTDIADIRAGAYNATRGTGNAWTIQVPEGTDMSNPSLTVRTVVDGAKVTSVNGEAYTDGMTVDLSEGKTLTIVVTALDGTTTGTHTVTAKFGDKKPAEEYHDIPAGGMGEWVTKAINYGLMSNTGANDEGKKTFDPNAKVERKYFALMVARADVMAKDATITDKDAADEKLKSLYSGTPAFSDAPANDETVNAALEYCKTNGIISGYEDGTFKPNNYVGRTEAASILVGWLKLPDAGEENTNNFKDWNAIGWAHGKVNSVVKAGVMSGIGDGYFGTGTLTREQTAVILTRAFENLRDSK